MTTDAEDSRRHGKGCTGTETKNRTRIETGTRFAVELRIKSDFRNENGDEGLYSCTTSAFDFECTNFVVHTIDAANDETVLYIWRARAPPAVGVLSAWNSQLLFNFATCNEIREFVHVCATPLLIELRHRY
ncbi:hypothetical protein EVAR_16350_1 [Eumeta japonica]|uniref:Uncharacterized protein n=1 Tax=Eumeta variegata TaxID=151549 RepID=A0A4C1VIA2_EUMVA|nr:hypothetical protein EVAR_16350_1 [Eumeta japonica]